MSSAGAAPERDGAPLPGGWADAATLRAVFRFEGAFQRGAGGALLRTRMTIAAPGAAPRPDLLVVMMNPGSARGVDGEGLRPLSAPDATQYQIARLMLGLGLRRAHVVNLFDLCEAKPARAWAALARAGPSLFDPARAAERVEALPPGPPVLLGWGLRAGLPKAARGAYDALTRRCLDALAGRDLRAVLRCGGAYAPLRGVASTQAPHVAHPSPQPQALKRDWLRAARALF